MPRKIDTKNRQRGHIPYKTGLLVPTDDDVIAVTIYRTRAGWVSEAQVQIYDGEGAAVNAVKVGGAVTEDATLGGILSDLCDQAAMKTGIVEGDPDTAVKG